MSTDTFSSTLWKCHRTFQTSFVISCSINISCRDVTKKRSDCVWRIFKEEKIYNQQGQAAFEFGHLDFSTIIHWPLACTLKKKSVWEDWDMKLSSLFWAVEWDFNRNEKFSFFHMCKWLFAGTMGTSSAKDGSSEIIWHICIYTEFAFIKFKLRYIPEDNKGGIFISRSIIQNLF